ncbi:TatD family hydrolase [Flavobacterium sp. F-65]|jgi:TatD DNase family protein|uniref:TatD family hydrolase n=1 Tax=Flavobacterium pisciphilum TaxID=2893755 RepID=A0ABS8MZS6_9FLAO|nr:TatD family hydrolase [Flavobacterium sp. F-65]MCC9074296.1 TatD family hydrolase [Flavobacterium sp. F-65]
MEFFNFHTHKSINHPDILDLVNQYPNDFDEGIAYYSIGIHPWYIVKDRIEADLEIIDQKLATENCLAIGECGLDKRTEVPFELQVAVFEKQLLLAQKHQKPVVIHCVAAFQEVIALKKKLTITVPMIIHGFSKNEQVAKQLLDNGFYISFGKYLIKNPHLETVFKSIPDNRFFLETDTIDENIETVYALAAKYKNITIDELKQLIWSNFKIVFNK